MSVSFNDIFCDNNLEQKGRIQPVIRLLLPLLLSHKIQSCIPLGGECNAIFPLLQYKVFEEKKSS